VLASLKEVTRLIKTHFGVGGETVTALVQERGGEGIELLQETEVDDSELAKTLFDKHKNTIIAGFVVWFVLFVIGYELIIGAS
jgi:hypothetical protein